MERSQKTQKIQKGLGVRLLAQGSILVSIIAIILGLVSILFGHQNHSRVSDQKLESNDLNTKFQTHLTEFASVQADVQQMSEKTLTLVDTTGTINVVAGNDVYENQLSLDSGTRYRAFVSVNILSSSATPLLNIILLASGSPLPGFPVSINIGASGRIRNFSYETLLPVGSSTFGVKTLRATGDNYGINITQLNAIPVIVVT